MLDDTKLQMRSEQYYLNIVEEKILEFLHQCKYQTDTENQMQQTFTTKDYTLHQFFCYIARKKWSLEKNIMKKRNKVIGSLCK